MFKFLTVLSLFSFVTLAPGQQGSYASVHNNDSPRHHKAMGSEAAAELTTVLNANDQLFDTLLGKDQSKVELAAKALSDAIHSTKSADLKDLRAIKNLLDGIKGSNTKDQNLEVYSKVVPQIVELVKVIKPEGFSVYYCPMVKKEWIQNEKKHSGVKNVFAQEMLECGGKV